MVGLGERCHLSRRLCSVGEPVDANDQSCAQKIRPIGRIHKLPAPFSVDPRNGLAEEGCYVRALKLRYPGGDHQPRLPVEGVAGITHPTRRKLRRHVVEPVIVVFDRIDDLVVESAEIGVQSGGLCGVDVDGGGHLRYGAKAGRGDCQRQPNGKEFHKSQADP